MPLKVFSFILIFLVIGLAACAKPAASPPFTSSSSPPPVSTPDPSPTLAPDQPAFGTPKKSPHWESNTPEHGSILAAVPINIVIDFNFDLGPGSEISIIKNGKEYGTGETVVDDNKLTMRRTMDSGAPNGIYRVEYIACWPDGSCHEGYFEFGIDRSKAQDYEELRDTAEVTVVMKGIAFVPPKIRISAGTKIIWINEDSVTHYVNTDGHPAHTYYLEMNSKALNEGDTYSITLNTPGIYLYHCSAHTDMKGSILVD
jgi:plastocyanin